MPLDFNAALEISSLSQKTYRLLYEQIIRGSLAPGEKLDIVSLASQLGISRTPVKEAINRLAQDGLVKIRSRSGTYVSTLEPEMIRELFEVRLMIELWAAEWAVRNPNSFDMRRVTEIMQEAGSLFQADKEFDYTTFCRYDSEFHSLIVDSAKNSRMSDVYQSLHPHIQIMRVHWGKARDRAFISHEEHLKIVDSLGRANYQLARDALKKHILNTCEYTLRLLPEFLSAGNGKRNTQEHQRRGRSHPRR